MQRIVVGILAALMCALCVCSAQAEDTSVVVDMDALTGRILSVKASGAAAGEPITYAERL